MSKRTRDVDQKEQCHGLNGQNHETRPFKEMVAHLLSREYMVRITTVATVQSS